MKKISVVMLCAALVVAVSLPSFAVEVDENLIKQFYNKPTAYSPATLDGLARSVGLEMSPEAVANVPSSYAKVVDGKVVPSNKSIAYSPKDMHSILTAYGLVLEPEDAANLPSYYGKVVDGKVTFSNTSTAFSGDSMRDILSHYTLYVQKSDMVTTAPTPTDSDGDGVPDSIDRCPNTPPNAKVDKYGCPFKVKVIDTDDDGVPDEQDVCPGTPAGANIDERGCWVLEQQYLFGFDKDKIQPQFYPILDDVVKVMNSNPTMGVTLEGHTDSVGPAAYNQGLSERRANAVKTYLINNGGISSSRLNTVGYGETRPIAPNNTKEGRAKNRRVELTPNW